MTAESELLAYLHRRDERRRRWAFILIALAAIGSVTTWRTLDARAAEQRRDDRIEAYQCALQPVGCEP